MKNIKKKSRNENGFTLIEVAVAAGILGALTLLVATLFIRTIDTYGQVMNDTDTVKQARHSVEMVAREMREAFSFEIFDGGAGPDALLITSARLSDTNVNPLLRNAFCIDGPPFVASSPANTFLPTPSSLILFYMNASPEGIPQLVRHQLYYAEDLSAYTPPFIMQPGGPYVGTDFVIVDSVGVALTIDRATGTVAGVPTFKPPRILLNRASTFDIFPPNINPINPALSLPAQVVITCQYVNRYGRTATSRFFALIDQRNI